MKISNHIQVTSDSVMSKSSGIVLDCKNSGDIFDDSRYRHSIVNHNCILVRGMHGRGMYFNGVNAYLDCGNDASLNIPDAITIEVWLKVETSQTQMVVSKTDRNVDESWQLFLNSVNTVVFATTSGGGYVHSAGPTITTGKWSCVVAVYDGTYLRVYLNGVEGDTPTAQGSIDLSAEPVRIGARNTDGITTFYLHGNIDEVRGYNYALSADEIKLHYLQQSPYYKELAPTII